MTRLERARAASLARRQSQRPTPGATPSTNPAYRPVTVLPGGTGRVIKTRGTKLTATQRNSEGRPSEWNRSPQFFTDPKWSRTMRECE